MADVQEEREQNLIPAILAAVTAGVVFGLIVVAVYHGGVYAVGIFMGM